jgi:hypothetical protein
MWIRLARRGEVMILPSVSVDYTANHLVGKGVSAHSAKKRRNAFLYMRIWLKYFPYFPSRMKALAVQTKNLYTLLLWP